MRISYMQIMNNLMQTGLTVSLAALVPLLLRRVLKKRYPARAVCLVWALLALRLLVPVQLTLPEAPVQVTPRTNYVMQDDRMLSEQAGLPVEQTPARWVTDEQAAALSHAGTSRTTTFNLTAVLLGLWLAGVVISAIRQAVSYGMLKRRLDRTAVSAERADLLDVLASQRSGLGISRKIPLLISPAADCPMLAGFIRPALYLPDENISAADAAFIFRHELTHCRHGDLWLKLLLTAAQCVHWFNPLVYLIVRFAQEDIELACDDAVVRGQNAAYRRAYGETILRSAIAQSRRRQSLVSCFGDDKKTLMRRFEGLFDKSVKKRGAALIVLVALLTATLGGTIAVGTKKDPAAAEARALLMANTFAQAYVDEDAAAYMKYLAPDSDLAKYDDYFSTGAAVYRRYVTRYDPETGTALIVFEYVWDADRVAAMDVHAPSPGVPFREAMRLHFTGEGNDMLISSMTFEVSSDPFTSDPDNNYLVSSLDDFKLLYANDLGLPDFVAASDGLTIGSGDPTQAAETLLGLSPAASQLSGTDSAAPDITKVTFTFRDNSKVILTMVDQFGQGWLPQDWTDGKNAADRSAADLAQQYARGLLHKSGQYIYPILTPEKQQEFISQQYDMTGGTQWTWKFGSSSPSVRDYVLVPTDDDSAYRIICRMDGGGISDVRTGYLVQTTCEDGGRRMISDVTELSDADMTQSELFRLYYSTGLALPSLPDEVGNFSGLPRTDSLTAAQDAFYYFGNPVDGSKTGWIADVTQIQSIVRSDIRGGAYIDIVQLTFTDGSDPINVQMEKTGTGYWKPTGIQEDVSAMSGANVLPVSADAFGAISFANLPTLNTGDIIIFNFGSKPVGGVTLVNRLVNAAGSPRYQNMTDDETTLMRTNSGYVYTIPQSVSELLASDLSVPFYHALTLEYTDAQHIRHTAVAAYMTNAMTQLENPPLPSGGYYSDALGCILQLPQEFRNAVSANINTDGTMTFFVKDTDSVLMTLTVQPISVLKRDFGENWAENYPVPVRPLAEWDGLAYFLIYPSDVQYDPADEQAAAQYQTMFEAAQNISAEDLALDADPHDTSAYAERATAVLLGYLDAGIVDSETETALFDELDHRAQADGVSFSAAMRQAGENAQALWHKHLADES